jgi:hypothetical protein
VTERVDLDRLADYIAGLLDGTPDAADIERLVRTDPEWARAHADLRTADALVATDLAALGAEPVRMPTEVAARLAETLDGAGGAGDRTVVVSLAARRRRRKRWAAVAAVAAGVAVLGLVGPPLLSRTTRDGAGEEALTSARGGAGIPPAAAPAESGLIVRATGMDYRRDAAWKSTAEAPQYRADSDASVASGRASAVPADLLRLYDPTSRQDCLNAVTREYGGQPESVDYARFEGDPALIVILMDGRRAPFRLVAVGPNCGLGGKPDVRHTTPIP